MDARAEKEQLAMAYAQTYPTCTETGGLMPVHTSSTHLKVPLLVAIPATLAPRAQRRQLIFDEEAQELLLAEYTPFTQWAATFLICVGLLVCSGVIYLAICASVPLPPQGLTAA
ncbi:uncharacterized protein BKCO1_2300051 [Diplodia corticola]|uniref:Uncharacterized protein n=1 Tax=Diplodia corticola TaxID=236234 RepID=A0A1J9R2A5_9PEZI|nr:uncharacterized protein BKCO1_2300051 [Diplodia corticola]OJD34370.1 hypothetical protein BKCO1_2300051 [Diplodia corticola]